MTILLPHDSLRLAAALLVRASAGSALTALVLLVLASSSSYGPISAGAYVTQRATVGEASVDARVGGESISQSVAIAVRACLPISAPKRRYVVRPCVADATLPPTRGP